MFSKRLLAGVAGAVALGLAGSAMAEEVTNTVTVEPTASVTAAHTSVQLTLDGSQGEENYDTFASSLSHLNNTAADISVDISATDLPADLVYWLFRGKTEVDAIAAIESDAAHDTLNGVFRYDGSTVNTGVSTVFASVVANSAAVDLPVVYAADARNSLPPPADHVTTVTWTIAPTP